MFEQNLSKDSHIAGYLSISGVQRSGRRRWPAVIYFRQLVAAGKPLSRACTNASTSNKDTSAAPV